VSTSYRHGNRGHGMNTHLGDLTAELVAALDEGRPTDRIVAAIGEAVIDARDVMEYGRDLDARAVNRYQYAQ
jgi:chemotaxis regulatin CheY-phosphate phosphatase CheZ